MVNNFSSVDMYTELLVIITVPPVILAMKRFSPNAIRLKVTGSQTTVLVCVRIHFVVQLKLI